MLLLPDLAATQRLGMILGRSLPPSSILLLKGDLGSGKTTLVQGIGLGLGIGEAIVSPTFTLINEYPEGRIPLYHLDLYRLEPAEVAALHLEIYWEGREMPLGIVAIEWAERLALCPDTYLQIRLTLNEDNSRTADFTVCGRPLDLAAMISEFEKLRAFVPQSPCESPESIAVDP